jgi:Cysteine-rich CWC
MDTKLPEGAGQACSACGARFECGMQAGKEKCWCAELPAVMPMSDVAGGCYCPACLRERIAAADAARH